MNTITKIEIDSDGEARRAAAGGWRSVAVWQAYRGGGTPQMEENAARRVLDEAGLVGEPIPQHRGAIQWRTIDRMVAEKEAQS